MIISVCVRVCVCAYQTAHNLTLERLCMKVRVIFSMCVYSLSSRRFLCSFSLFRATSLSSISSL